MKFLLPFTLVLILAVCQNSCVYRPSTTEPITSGVTNVVNISEWFEAVKQRDIPQIQVLIAAGVDVNARNEYDETALIASIYHNNTEIIKLLLAAGTDIDAQNNHGDTALMLAVGRPGLVPRCEIEAVKLLLAAGADVNIQANNGTALMWGASRGNVDIVKLLLDAGADIHAKCGIGTALMWAAYRGRVETIKHLLAAGADVNAKSDNGETALMWAVGKPGISAGSKIEAVKPLLAAGAGVNMQANNGETALMWAAHRGNIDLVKLLLDSGADVNIKNEEGKTARQIAVELKFNNIVKLLDGETIADLQSWLDAMDKDMTWAAYHKLLRENYNYPHNIREWFLQRDKKEDCEELIDPTTIPREEWQRFIELAYQAVFQNLSCNNNLELVSKEASVVDFTENFVYVLFLLPRIEHPHPEYGYLYRIKLNRKTGEILLTTHSSPIKSPQP